ncbi:MAG: 8-amino-7-oxononanoate synthase [Candidatus Handelsmanbacteria bacterium]|nr:8-amino-7-oxononanoate synthase [Candidatus Handelsmanbacteria bacterium]
MADKYAFISAELERREREGLRRRLRPVVPGRGVEVEVEGRQLVNFSTNDYLGLASHPLVLERAAQYLRQYGAGARASRLVCGSHPGFAPVEEKLARLKGRDSALVFNSGFQANASLLPALCDRHTLLLLDRLAHGSLILGAQAAGCRVWRFQHNDLDHLRQLLQQHRNAHPRVIIATESVFSMDGGQSEVGAIAGLAAEFEALLLLDEAHATGVLGPGGAGLSCGHPVDLVMGTLSKALGAFGAYVACEAPLREYLINCCSGLVYSTGLPPAVLGAADAALELLPRMDAERAQLQGHADFLRGALQAQGWDTAASTTQIVPVVVGQSEKALGLAAWLEEQGALAVAIRPPTVPAGQARLRLALSALHTRAQLEWLVELLGRWREQN